MNLSDLTLPAGWIVGVDLSRVQGEVDAQALVDVGVSFAWIKATDGLHDVDGKPGDTSGLYATADACDRAELPYGLYAVIEPYGAGHAAAQAAHFLDVADGLGATLPPALDFELGHGRTAVDLLESATAWCAAVEAADRPPILYAGPAFIDRLEALGGPLAHELAAKLARRPLWLPDYGRIGATPQESLDRLRPRVPSPWSDWAIWQISGDHGVALPGGRGWVDVDVTRMSIEELVALGTPEATAAPC